MKRDLSSTWERFVYGPDDDEETKRPINTSSTSATGTALSTGEKQAISPEDSQKEFVTHSINQTSTNVPDGPQAASTGSNETPNETWRSRTDSRRLTWRPNIFQPRPFAGIAGLCVTVGCVFTSLAILKASDGQPVDSWAVEPTVYLAIVAAVANSALRLARFQAIPISWYHLQFAV